MCSLVPRPSILKVRKKDGLVPIATMLVRMRWPLPEKHVFVYLPCKPFRKSFSAKQWQTIFGSHWDISNLAEPVCKIWCQRFPWKKCDIMCTRQIKHCHKSYKTLTSYTYTRRVYEFRHVCDVFNKQNLTRQNWYELVYGTVYKVSIRLRVFQVMASACALT